MAADEGINVATPKELVKIVADALYVPEASVSMHDRNLANAGLRTMTGRGLSAARVTPRDAARLLIATAASRNVKDSVSTVETYGNLISVKKWESRYFQPPELTRLSKNHTLADALVALIDAGISGTLGEFTPNKEGSILPDFETRIVFTFMGPVPSAEIDISRKASGRGGVGKLIYELERGVNGGDLMGLQYQTFFSERAIMDVVSLLTDAPLQPKLIWKVRPAEKKSVVRRK